MGRSLRVLAVPMLGLVLIWVIGAALHRLFGAAAGAPQPSWSAAFFNSYCLLFMEHITEVPEHWVGQLVQYVQPVLGVVLLLEGVLKLGLSVFRKDQNANAWVEIMASLQRGHIVVCGLGTVGFRVVQELQRIDEEVYVIERDPDGEFIERAKSLGAQVMQADARDEAALRRLNVTQARAVIVATDDDLANLEIAMNLRELNDQVPVVLRLFDQRLASKVRHTLGVEVSFSTSQLAAPLFASAALDPSVVGTHRVGDALLLVIDLEVSADGQLAGKTVGWVGQTQDLTVLARREGEGSWQPQPKPGARLSAGDHVQVLVASDRVAEVHALNGAG